MVKFKRFFSSFLAKKKGFSMGVSLGVVSGALVVAAGAATVVVNTQQNSKTVEGGTVAYFAAEKGMEYALYDISGHLAGYQVDNQEEYGKLVMEDLGAKSEIIIDSQSEEENSTEISIPAKGEGISNNDEDWNTIRHGQPARIPLYIDTSAKD